MVIIQERLAQIAGMHIKSGKHNSFEHGACTMEIVAYVAGEEWSDSPTCACPVISVFMRLWNDGLRSDEERDRLLKPLISQLVDSKSTPVVKLRRSFLALDWLIRVYTPKWLDLVPSLALHAKELRDMEEIADPASATAADAMVRAAGASAEAAAEAAAGASAEAAAVDAAWDAAVDAAWAAAGASAEAAAVDAAWDAAVDAAWAAAGASAEAAAVDAAWDAAVDAAEAAARASAGASAEAAAEAAAGNSAGAEAWAAAWDAARAAARDALKPTTEFLQQSALDLVERMLAVGCNQENLRGT